ncbi:MAG TPA: TIGR02996 domain-containing protein [Pirellulales bacterium]
MDGQAFLDAIRADLDDDAPRLIYADWLEETDRIEGAARADFIRVQCALAREPLDHAERTDWLVRERELLEDHRAAWEGPLRKLGAETIEFRRGFAEFIELSAGSFRRHDEAIIKLTPGLRGVELSLRGATVLQLRGWTSLRRLQHLGLPACDLGEDGARLLAGSPHLLNLRSLSLWRNGIGATGARSLAAAPALGNLEHLDLYGNDLGRNGVEALARSPVLGKLRSLDLSDNGLRGPAAMTIAESPRLRELESLDLEGNEINRTAAEDMAAHLSLPKLRRLNLRRNRLGAKPETLRLTPGFNALEVFQV